MVSMALGRQLVFGSSDPQGYTVYMAHTRFSGLGCCLAGSKLKKADEQDKMQLEDETSGRQLSSWLSRLLSPVLPLAATAICEPRGGGWWRRSLVGARCV